MTDAYAAARDAGLRALEWACGALHAIDPAWSRRAWETGAELALRADRCVATLLGSG